MPRGRKHGSQAPHLWGEVRRTLAAMHVGQTCAFFPEPGGDRDILQPANERWVKKAGWKFSTHVCLMVDTALEARRCILVTRTA